MKTKLTSAQLIEAQNAIEDMERRVEDLCAEARGELSGHHPTEDELKNIMDSPLIKFHKNRIQRAADVLDKAMERFSEVLTEARQWCEDYEASDE